MYAYYDSNEHVRGDTPERWGRFFGSITPDLAVDHLCVSPEFKLVKQALKPGSRVLEAGCGPGYWARLLHNLGYEAEGLDFNEELILKLRRSAPEVRWHCEDLRKLSLVDASFDVILCWGVVEHFEEGPKDLLMELHRILRPDGTCYVSVPYLNWMRRHLWLRGSTNRGTGRTVFNQNYFSADELRNHLIHVGFDEVRFHLLGRTLQAAVPIVSRIRPHFCRRVINRLAFFLPGEASSHMILAICRKAA